MKKILALLITAITFLSFNSKALAQETKPAESNALLYKISGKDLQKPSYLYGTIHIICQNDMFGMDKINSYIEQSEQLLMELEMDNLTELQSMQTKAAMPDGKTLKDFLTAEQYAKVDETFKNYAGVSVETVKNIRPMLLSVLITANAKSMGCQQLGSYDLNFMQNAIAKKKDIVGLETVDLQFQKIDRKPFEVQAKELYEMALDPNKSINEFKSLIGVYKSQNAEILYKTITGSFGSSDVEKALLDERNTDWIPKIEKAIADKSTFIAVGGGHLGGNNGVINLLRKKGYTVEPIKL